MINETLSAETAAPEQGWPALDEARRAQAKQDLPFPLEGGRGGWWSSPVQGEEERPASPLVLNP